MKASRTSPEREAAVRAEQVRLAAAHRGTEGLVLVAVVTIVSLTVWPNELVLPWALLTALACAIRALLPARVSSLVAGSLLVGLAWGGGYFVLVGPLSPSERSILLVILAGLGAGGLVRLSVLPQAAVAWLLPLLLPAVGWHLASEHRGDPELAVLLAALLATSLLALRRLAAARRRGLRLRLDYADLRQALTRAEHDREHAHAGLQAMIEQASDLIAVVSADGSPLFVSSALARLLDAVHVKRPIELVHPDDRGALLAAQADLVEGRVAQLPHLAWRVAEPNDQWREVEGHARLLTEGPYQGAVLMVARDVTGRNQVARQLARKEDLLRALFDATPDPIFYKDIEGRYLGCNDAYAEVVGRSSDELLGLTDEQLHPGDIAARSRDRDRAAIETGEPQRDEYWMELPSGKRVLLDTVKCPFRDGQGRPGGVVGICRDITSYRLLEDKLRQAATTDALTGLMNRRRLDEVLAEEWARARRQGEPLSVIMADIDHFKAYNDALGHAAGDTALARVAGQLRHCVARPGDVVARYGGEEFTLVLPHTGSAGAMAVAEHVLAAVKHAALPHPASDAADVVTVSLGVASATPGRQQPVSELVSAADAALYDSKASGRNTVRARDLK